MSVKTCTQPRSEVATVGVCCGESPASKSGCRCCIFGSWHLQTAHTSDHCDLRRCGALYFLEFFLRFLAASPPNSSDSRCCQKRNRGTVAFSSLWLHVLCFILKEVTAYIYSKFDFLPGTKPKIRNHKPTCTVTGLIINFICRASIWTQNSREW